jgi:2-polyprenyl-3-methyl-5-hydroxy-6-metoxy-1,4-benzoquinol methylase
MNRLCPVCFSSQKDVLFEQKFYANSLTLMNGYKVVVCDDCGFCFADEIPTQAEFDRYYEQMSKYEYDRYENHPSGDQMKHYAQIVDFIEPHLTDKKVSILDLGCSTGGLLSIFKQRGFSNLLGIDPSPACVNSVQRLFGIDSRVNNFSGLTDAKKYDLVILSEVLEHIVDLKEILAKIRNLLSDKGYLFIEVPDSGRWEAQISAPFQQFSVEHINYFSQGSLDHLLLKNGFQATTRQEADYVSEKINEPVIMLLAAKSSATASLKKDTPQTVRKYVAKCHENDRTLKMILSEKLSGVDRLIVWGVGTHTLRLLEHGLDIAKITYFVDSNPRYTGKTINGLEIKAPEDIREPDMPILVSTFLYQDEIVHQIQHTLRLQNRVITIYYPWRIVK